MYQLLNPQVSLTYLARVGYSQFASQIDLKNVTTVKKCVIEQIDNNFAQCFNWQIIKSLSALQ
ncbi:hypothetical protein VIOR3934_09038 [Vibrio orientalis CIP 102891 = ATCC 33934]|uniref:Uncharacterized protein n=1 Tax=Vibrio orientalis CIP 102891 = ATCC 33934 TaxID=675816 RepID=C9QJL9_VIBOR|nr:hypothetical protein VIA_002519 [Vibrio orientalis CIP 102891 = ATCC 33934]EGU47934.1 hypothetical protein VIOR3934_09038 [Vibrio orientalis CIP 102891 = ATCC 33934]